MEYIWNIYINGIYIYMEYIWNIYIYIWNTWNIWNIYIYMEDIEYMDIPFGIFT